MPIKDQSNLHICFTTSRNPSRRTRTLIKDFAHVIPKATRISRGTKNLYELAAEALASRNTLLVVVSTRKGNPGTISFYRVTEQGFFQLPLELSLKGVKLRYEITRQRMPRGDTLLILSITHSSRVQRFCEMLSKIFEAPLIEEHQIVENSTIIMKIKESNNLIHLTFTRGVLDKEVGPQLHGTVKFLERP
ncbi:MAG: hypothetical protein ACE5R6_12230 [Candidatus Heimdallarchaeota archaeon]